MKLVKDNRKEKFMSNEKQKVVIYTRVATQEQAKSGYSLKAQDKMLKEYARVNNFEIVGEFSDIGSGFEQNRQGFNEMLQYLESSENCKTILITDLKRLSRNVNILEKMQQYNLISVSCDSFPLLNQLSILFEKKCRLLIDEKARMRFEKAQKLKAKKGKIENVK